MYEKKQHTVDVGSMLDVMVYNCFRVNLRFKFTGSLASRLEFSFKLWMENDETAAGVVSDLMHGLSSCHWDHSHHMVKVNLPL